MSRLNRAKLFAPFAALDGFEGRVRNKEIPYVRRHEFDPDEVWELNRRLNILHGLTLNSKQARANRVRVRVEYFEKCTDPDSDAFGVKGLYYTVEGFVQCVDCVFQTLLLTTADDNGVHACRAISQISTPSAIRMNGYFLWKQNLKNRNESGTDNLLFTLRLPLPQSIQGV